MGRLGNDIPIDRVPDYSNGTKYRFAKGYDTSDVHRHPSYFMIIWGYAESGVVGVIWQE